MNFKDAANRVVNPGPAPPSFHGTSAQWKEHSQQFRVPPGAKMIELMFTLFNAKSGRLDFDDVRLASVPVEVIDAAEAASAAKEAARIASLPKPKPQVAVPSADTLPPELHVVGNQLRDPAGRAVWLQGVAIPSLEVGSAGVGSNPGVRSGSAIKDWRQPASVSGVPRKLLVRPRAVSERRRDALPPARRRRRQRLRRPGRLPRARPARLPADGSPRGLLEGDRPPVQESPGRPLRAVQRAARHLVDRLARRRAGDGIRNDPGNAPAEDQKSLVTFTSVGMQRLVNVIRHEGARNVVIAGGLDWGHDLSGVVKGYCARRPRRQRGRLFQPRLPVEERLAGEVPRRLGEIPRSSSARSAPRSRSWTSSRPTGRKTPTPGLPTCSA